MQICSWPTPACGRSGPRNAQEAADRRLDSEGGSARGDLIANANPELIDVLKKLPTVWVLGRPRGAWGASCKSTIRRSVRSRPNFSSARGIGIWGSSVRSRRTRCSCAGRRESTFFAEHAGARVSAFLGDNRRWTFPLQATNEVEMVQDLVDRLLKVSDRPTAIFAPDDSVGAMTAQALSARGLLIGEDISLMSCNKPRRAARGDLRRPRRSTFTQSGLGALTVAHLAFSSTRGCPAGRNRRRTGAGAGESVVRHGAIV